KVDYNEIIRRLAGRRHCTKCGAGFNTVTNPPKVAELCDACGSTLTVRDDDSVNVAGKRLAAYDAQARPLLEFFAGKGHAYFEVNGAEGEPPVIAKQICDWIRRQTNGAGRSPK